MALGGGCSLVDMLSIVIGDGVGLGDETERERGGEGEPGEEQHLKCGDAKAGRCDESRNRGVLHARRWPQFVRYLIRLWAMIAKTTHPPNGSK